MPPLSLRKMLRPLSIPPRNLPDVEWNALIFVENERNPIDLALTLAYATAHAFVPGDGGSPICRDCAEWASTLAVTAGNAQFLIYLCHIT